MNIKTLRDEFKLYKHDENHFFLNIGNFKSVLMEGGKRFSFVSSVQRQKNKIKLSTIHYKMINECHGCLYKNILKC